MEFLGSGRRRSALFFLFQFLAGAVFWVLFGTFGLILMSSLVLGAALLIRLEWLRRREGDFRQVSSLAFLHSTLKPRKPLPPLGGWSVSPDFAAVLVSLIQSEKPRVILEAGSGVSTVLAAYALEGLGGGKVHALEHSPEFADKTEALLAEHHLRDYAEVVRAPLKETPLGGKSWLWYDASALASAGTIDMMIVDGPPGSIGPLARYPALPLFIDRLSPEAVLVLDDGLRKDERLAAERWMKEFPEFEKRECDAEKGMILLKRRGKK